MKIVRKNVIGTMLVQIRISGETPVVVLRVCDRLSCLEPESTKGIMLQNEDLLNDKMPELESDNDDDSDDDWEPCDSPDLSLVSCLFCHDIFRSCEETFEHCKIIHGFDLGKLKFNLQLDSFSYIRLINYIRKENVSPSVLLKNPGLQDILSNDEYMKPVKEDDELLMFDIEGFIPIPDQEISTELSLPIHNSPDSECLKHERLLQKLADVETKLKETEQQLQFTRYQLNEMRAVVVRCLEMEHKCKSDSDDNTLTTDADGGYFEAYAHFSIHHEMLHDKARTTSYRDSILNNSTLFTGKVVLDVGCGTGILSMFAAQGGALAVFGVDHSEIVYQAIDIVRDNNLEPVVKLMKGRMEDTTLPIEAVDILISEWMGYFLLFESMLNTVLYARDKYLKADGLMLPNRCTINLAGISDLENHQKYITFWDDVYGFKMSSLKTDVLREASVEIVAEEKLLTTSFLILDLNLKTCTSADSQFVSTFQLRILRTGLLTAFAGWFDAYFNLPNKIILSTSPMAPTTHWKQTVFYLHTPIPVIEGEVINGKLSCMRLMKDPRALKISLTFDDQHYTYILQ